MRHARTAYTVAYRVRPQPYTPQPCTAHRVVHHRLEERRRVEFDFDRIAVLGLPAFELPKGGAEELGAATGLGAKSNVKRAEDGKKVLAYLPRRRFLWPHLLRSYSLHTAAGLLTPLTHARTGLLQLGLLRHLLTYVQAFFN